MVFNKRKSSTFAVRLFGESLRIPMRWRVNSVCLWPDNVVCESSLKPSGESRNNVIKKLFFSKLRFLK